MSYAVSAALQKAIFLALGANADLQTAVNGAIYDTLPAGQTPDLFVLLGPETARTKSDGSAKGSQHDLTISVVSTSDAFVAVKTIAGQIVDLLDDRDLALERGTLVFLRFQKAAARKLRNSAGRQVDLIFRARVDDI